MDLPELIAALTDPHAYPHPAASVEVRQTHISAVFLAGDYAYKVKKPVTLGFLDFGTLDRRRKFCEAEVTLNRRLAPDVYLGVVPVTRTAAGAAVGGDGEVVEWAVRMRRLPDDATLLARLQRGEVSAPDVEGLARRVAAFHARAEGGERVAAFGRYEVVAGNARENFTQAEPWVGRAVSRVVFDRLRTLTEAHLNRHRPLIERRAAAGVPRDTHGDLHLNHIYLFPDRPPPGDVVVVDCVEFSDRFRYADPVADMAFLAMDLGFRGRGDLAGAFADEYFRAAEDPEGRRLLPFYAAYRSVVRAKVEGFRADEPEVPVAARAAALQSAQAHWLYALGELEGPGRRPVLVLVGGLPGAGKSVLAAGLGARFGFRVVRSDVVRKELAGVSAGTAAPVPFGTGLYAADVTELIYAECLCRAERALFEGGRVVVDASFGVERHRRAFLDAAARLAVPGLFLHCEASPEVAEVRLAARRGDASDADREVRREAARRWQDIGPQTVGATRTVPADGPADTVLAQAADHLRAAGMAD